MIEEEEDRNDKAELQNLQNNVLKKAPRKRINACAGKRKGS